jgi:hypothetical protein
MQYPTTLADNNTDILFSEMLKFSIFIFSNKKLVKEKIVFVEMKISKLINYSTNMC